MKLVIKTSHTIPIPKCLLPSPAHAENHVWFLSGTQAPVSSPLNPDHAGTTYSSSHPSQPPSRKLRHGARAPCPRMHFYIRILSADSELHGSHLAHARRLRSLFLHFHQPSLFGRPPPPPPPRSQEVQDGRRGHPVAAGAARVSSLSCGRPEPRGLPSGKRRRPARAGGKVQALPQEPNFALPRAIRSGAGNVGHGRVAFELCFPGGGGCWV